MSDTLVEPSDLVKAGMAWYGDRFQWACIGHAPPSYQRNLTRYKAELSKAQLKTGGESAGLMEIQSAPSGDLREPKDVSQ